MKKQITARTAYANYIGKQGALAPLSTISTVTTVTITFNGEFYTAFADGQPVGFDRSRGELVRRLRLSYGKITLV